jgi:uncharacterized cofD-like protein
MTNLLSRFQRRRQNIDPAANQESGYYVRQQTGIIKKSVQWLAPGLFVKRWFAVTLVGVAFIALGLAIWVRLMPIRSLVEFADNTLKITAKIVPNRVSGPVILASGFFLLFWGQLRSLKAVTGALSNQGDKTLLEMLLTKRRRSRGPKIVAVGGGTGLSTLLRGLKHYSANITAVVTVADDGGSSGKLRRDFGVLPPGDIRNCIAALADEEKLLTELFQYRFSSGEGLEGHSFGNLFLTAMSDITGDLEQGIAASSKVLAIQGRVLPATLCHVDLWAEMADGRYVEGESKITDADGQIVKIGCIPENPPALPAVIKAIEEADFIIVGPGSLYTSVIPNLLVPEIAKAIDRSKVPCVYICNIMTQPGETTGYRVSDHIKAIDHACHKRLFDAVLVEKNVPSDKSLARYRQEHASYVEIDIEEVRHLNRQLVPVSVMEEDDQGYLRHNSRKLARALMLWYRQQKAELKDVKKEVRKSA